MSDQQDHQDALRKARALGSRNDPDYRRCTTLINPPDWIRQRARETPGVWSRRADEYAAHAATELEEVRRLISAEQYPDPRDLAEAVAGYAHNCHIETAFRTIHFFAADESESGESES